MARKNQMTDLADVISIMEPSRTLLKKSFCITGHLGKPRKDIEQLIVNAGGVIHKTVGFDTTYLLTNEDWTPNSTKGGMSTKYKKALQYRTEIISEAKFYNLLSSEGN